MSRSDVDEASDESLVRRMETGSYAPDALANLRKIYRDIQEGAQAFLAAEDKRFFEHDGIDFWATGRALTANYLAGRTVQGASTLTQQLCKSLVGREKSYVRKAKEAILARRTESALSKLDILHIYLSMFNYRCKILKVFPKLVRHSNVTNHQTKHLFFH